MCGIHGTQVPSFRVRRGPNARRPSRAHMDPSGEPLAGPDVTYPTHDSLIVVAPTPPPVHGVSVFTLFLVASLRRLDYFSAHVDTRDSRSIETIGRVDFENIRLGLMHLIGLYRQLRAHPGAAVYVVVSQATLPFIRDSLFVGIAHLMGRRVYVHINGGGFGHFYDTAGLLTRWVVRRTFRLVTQVWVLTGSLRSSVADLVTPSQVRVLENVAEDITPRDAARLPSTDRPDAHRNKQRQDDPLHLLYLSNLLPEKGCFDLLDALAKLDHREDPRIEVRFVGWASSAVAAEFRRRREKLPGNVQASFRGIKSGAEKAAEFRWANVFALPTRYPPEGQPLVLLEAMAAGLPIVATRHAGIPETTRHGREALLIDVGDLDALTNAIRRIAHDAPLRDALGRRSRQRYVSRYAPDRLDRDLRELLSLSRPLTEGAARR